MSDTVTSGEPIAASTETASAPPAAADNAVQGVSATSVPAFGTSRGSGLARGKRVNASVQPVSVSTAAEYKPTAVQVITTQREYINPFAPEKPAAPAETIVQIASVATDLPVAAPAPTLVEAQPVPAPAPKLETAVPFAPPKSDPSAPKPELRILPPEEKARPSHSWDSDSLAGEKEPTRNEGRPAFQRRDDRPTFRPDRPEAPRENRQSDPRRERKNFEPRRENVPSNVAPRPAPVAPAPEPKKGGFFAWLKGLFAGAPDEAKPITQQPQTPGEGDRRFDPSQRRRHHRGGRGRGNFRDDQRDPRDDRGPSNSGGPSQENSGGERRYDQGSYPRRHRGGRGRGGNGDGGGYRGGDRRPDGNGPSQS